MPTNLWENSEIILIKMRREVNLGLFTIEFWWQCFSLSLFSNDSLDPYSKIIRNCRWIHQKFQANEILSMRLVAENPKYTCILYMQMHLIFFCAVYAGVFADVLFVGRVVSLLFPQMHSVSRQVVTRLFHHNKYEWKRKS